MRCSKCATENPAGKKFCGGCRSFPLPVSAQAAFTRQSATAGAHRKTRKSEWILGSLGADRRISPFLRCARRNCASPLEAKFLRTSDERYGPLFVSDMFQMRSCAAES
jgi:hypothetical protein